MVMHARKPQRISDGYFDKHQAHQFQNAKYSSKLSDRRVANEYVAADGRYSPMRSPNGNIPHSHRHSGHSHHHHAHSPEMDRTYTPSRSSYMHKICEKERDRDYKSSRDKYSDSIRSPKDKRSKNCERERTNHERSDMDLKKRVSGSSIGKYDKRSSGSVASEWTEHISSSGKRYYYNTVSEVSQWEKPREWDPRRSPKESRSQYGSSSRGYDKRVGSHSSRDCDRGSDVVHNDLGIDRRNKRSSGRGYWMNARGRDDERHRRSRHSGGHEDGHLMQDMDISPSCSTPMSELSYPGINEGSRGRIAGNNGSMNTGSHSGSHSGHYNTSAPPPPAAGSSHSINTRSIPPNQQIHPHGPPPSKPPPQQQQPPHHMAPQLTTSLLAAALPRITQPPNGTSPSSPNRGCNRSSSPPLRSCGRNSSPPTDPPTPTHSELTDQQLSNIGGSSGGIVVLENALPRKWDTTPMAGSVYNHHHGIHSTPVPPLTPSLVNYLRNDLTSHVNGWPAEILEKQVNKLMEDAHQVGSLMCTRVSAELKCARSVVRHTEIQATLQEQKLMYLRQQIARLEESKSQNSFMSDDA